MEHPTFTGALPEYTTKIVIQNLAKDLTAVICCICTLKLFKLCINPAQDLQGVPFIISPVDSSPDSDDFFADITSAQAVLFNRIQDVDLACL